MGSPDVGSRSGPLTVERAVVATLTKWLPTYVVAAARRYGVPEQEFTKARGHFPFRPRSINVATTFDDWNVDALPHIQVLSPGWEKAGQDETGIHQKHQVHVVCLVGAQDKPDTRLLRACYEDAILDALLQHGSLGGVAAATDVIGGGSAESDVDEKDTRTLQGSVTIFEVLVTGAMNPRTGPAAPDPLADVDGVPPVWPQDPTVIEGGATVVIDPEDP